MKVGIVGCGAISKVHLDVLRKLGNCKIVGVCDLVEEKALIAAKKYNTDAYTNFMEMIERETPDVIDILTPPQAHASVAIEAMNTGCNVLVEKPMTLKFDDADLMIETAARNKVKLGVVHSFLFNPAIQQALKLVDEGKIGQLVQVDTSVSLYPLLKDKNPPKWLYTLPGGLFGEIIPHALYVQLAFMGKVKRVRCLTKLESERSPVIPYSDLHVQLDGKNAVGSVLISTRIVSPHTLMTVTVVGSHGTLSINIPTATLLWMKTKGSKGLIARASTNLEPAIQLLSKSLSLGLKTLAGRVGTYMTYRFIIREFLHCVQTRSEPPVTAEEGRDVVRVANMIWDAIPTTDDKHSLMQG